MKNLFCIALFLMGCLIQAQSAFYNSGTLGVLNGASIGFHGDFINDGSVNADQSLAGFYGSTPLIIDGSNPATFFDVEFFTGADLFLNTTLRVANNANFVAGNIFGQPTDVGVTLNFQQNGFFTGENDLSKVVGFASVSDQANFSFPVGDVDQLRPLILNSEGANALASCAYFFENPNTPLTFDQQFDTTLKSRGVGEISNNEFWVVNGNVPSRITVSWNARSNLNGIANAIEEVILVGFNIGAQQWIVLGANNVAGDLTQGMITSNSFLPDNYGAITFAAVPLGTDTFSVNNPSLGNYFVSPNGDGISDVLIIEGMEESPNNHLYIFNRFGQKVFEQQNYRDEFDGFSNIDNLVLNRNQGLPEGVYYYIAILDDLELQYQGFLYLDQ